MAANAPDRVALSRALVRPGRRGGGTIVVFRLRRPMLLRVTVVRVFPTCEVVGSFRVRGRAGVNRVPFKGRLNGRPLQNGTYRLVIGTRAEATIVVARRKLSAARFRKARSANVCAPVIGFNWAGPGLLSSGGGIGAGGQDEGGVGAPLIGAAKGAVAGASTLARRVKGAITDPEPASTLFLLAVGFLTLLIAAVGLLIVTLAYRWHERAYR